MASCHPSPSDIDSASVILVGNPNVGKSVLFGRLTGQYVTVSNYPGTTVELTNGSFHDGERRLTIIDTPGVNNLIPSSEDEQVTRDILMNGGANRVIQVADTKNLRRSLFLTLQIAEMGLPFLLALNMEDEAKRRGISVDTRRLSSLLEIPVSATVATKGSGVRELQAKLRHACPSHFTVTYAPDIEASVTELLPYLPVTSISPRSFALMVLAGDESLERWLSENLSPEALQDIRKIRESLESLIPEGVGYRINQDRMAAADALIDQVMSQVAPKTLTFAQKLGRLAIHPVWGVPIMLAVLFAVYEFVGVFGAGTLVGLLEETLFGEYVNPFAIRMVKLLIPIPLVQDFLVGEYGVITMALTYAIALILPIVATFFLAFGLLEDSGYLPRLAAMMDRIFKAMGLNGKAVLPMILGLGCDTMATLTTRILESKKERVVVTLLLSLGVPCSAQLAVILAILNQMSWKVTAIWVGIVVGVLFLVGWAASRVLPGDSTDFILEIPPLRLPQLKNILVKTVARMEWYVKEAVPLFVIGTVILFTGSKTGLLAWLQEVTKPIVVNLLDLPPKAGQMFLIGFLRRDYGAVGFWEMQKTGQIDAVQVTVALVAITLFIPCIAQFFVTIKERGIRMALGIAAFTMTFSVGVAATVNFALRSWGVQL